MHYRDLFVAIFPANIYLLKIIIRNSRKTCEKCSKLTIMHCQDLLGAIFLANIYLIKVNNRNARERCEIYSKLTLKTPEIRH